MGMSRVAVKAEALPLQLRSEGLYVVDAIELASALCLKAMRLQYILRIKAEFPGNLWPNAAQAYHHWIKASIVQNKTRRANLDIHT